MISKETVEHIAKLARIELSEEEKEKLGKDLSSILDYVEKLNKVDTAKIKGISQVTGLSSVMRDDERRKDNKQLAIRDKLLREAPKRKKDYVQVPKILE